VIENGRFTAQRTTSITIPTIIPAPIGPNPVERARRGIRRMSTSSATTVATSESTRTVRTKRE
jgi:hypothetical protein